jgi:hypothetical protein
MHASDPKILSQHYHLNTDMIRSSLNSISGFDSVPMPGKMRRNLAHKRFMSNVEENIKSPVKEYKNT